LQDQLQNRSGIDIQPEFQEFGRDKVIGSNSWRPDPGVWARPGVLARRTGARFLNPARRSFTVDPVGSR